MMLLIALIVLLLFLLIQTGNLLVTRLRGYDKPLAAHTQTPSVSILVAARNEATQIATCLNALLQLDYPIHQLEILVGNDQSTDHTADIVAKYAQQYPHIKLLHITQNMGMAKGKANVLGHLAREAKGEILFITDADIAVPAQWVNTLLSFFGPNVGIVSGTTIVQSTGYLGNMQHTDWLYFMGILHNFSRIGVPGTAVGNNMAVTRRAYMDTGGYENLPFSITEDFKLYQAVRQKGYATVNMLHPGGVNLSAGAPNFNTLLNQRKRWLKGGLELPAYWWVVFAVFAGFYPAIMVVLWHNPMLGLLLWALKWQIQSLTIVLRERLVQHPFNFLWLLQYEAYSLGLTLLTAVYFVLPFKLNWKNRYY